MSSQSTNLNGSGGSSSKTLTVANEAALFALTAVSMNVRDTVVVTTGVSGGIEYYTVLDTTKLNSYAGYGVLRGGKAYFDGGKVFSDGLGHVTANKVAFPDMMECSISNGGTGVISLNATYTQTTGRLAANGDFSATYANFSGNISAPTATFGGAISAANNSFTVSSDGSAQFLVNSSHRVQITNQFNNISGLSIYDGDFETLIGYSSVNNRFEAYGKDFYCSNSLLAQYGLGIWGHAAPSSQPNLPVTLADVINILKAYGMCKSS